MFSSRPSSSGVLHSTTARRSCHEARPVERAFPGSHIDDVPVVSWRRGIAKLDQSSPVVGERSQEIVLHW